MSCACSCSRETLEAIGCDSQEEAHADTVPKMSGAELPEMSSSRKVSLEPSSTSIAEDCDRNAAVSSYSAQEIGDKIEAIKERIEEITKQKAIFTEDTNRKLSWSQNCT